MNRWRSSPRRSVSLPRADIPLLDVDRLTIRTDKTLLVDEVEFDVTEGSMVALIGAGRGRRTAVLDCIGNIRPASSGAVRVEGHRLKRAFTAATFWGVLGTGLLVGLLAAAAAVDVDRLWLAAVKRGLAVDEPFTPATFGQRIRSYFRAELAIDRLAGNWRIVTADGRKVLAVRRDLEEARELRHQLQAAVTARRTGPGTIPDLSDLVGDANEPRRRLPLDEATFAHLAGGKRLIRLRGWTALGAGMTLGMALALAFWQRGRRSAQVAARAGVARTFRQPRVFPEMTVFENLLVAVEQKRDGTSWVQRFSGRGGATPTEEADAWLAWCDLGDSGEQPAGGLSWFDRRRLELARALAIQPRLLLVDDPAEGLDSDQQQAVAMLLRDAQQRGVAIVLTAGVTGPLTEACDRTIVLERQPAR
jgi:ABC-type branched-subunit amino acid transport system ATPase component